MTYYDPEDPRTDAESHGLTYHVLKQPNDRHSVVLRWEHHWETDRVVCDNISKVEDAHRLVYLLERGGMVVADIRRIQDYGARQFRDEGREPIY